jgi:hypothetical protein
MKHPNLPEIIADNFSQLPGVMAQVSDEPGLGPIASLEMFQ